MPTLEARSYAERVGVLNTLQNDNHIKIPTGTGKKGHISDLGKSNRSIQIRILRVELVKSVISVI